MKPFERNVSSIYGAPMGRRSDNLQGKVRLQRVPWVEGDYDPGGAYWGWSATDSIWCAWNEEGEAYVRAPTREQAKQKFPGCTFYR